MRDSAFTLYAFLRIGFTEEAKKFFQFLESVMDIDSTSKDSGPLNVMYTIYGKTPPPETILDHLVLLYLL